MVRSAVSSDFDFIYSLYFHQDINPYLLYEIMEKADFQAIFDALLSNNNLYIFEVDGKKVGMFKLIPLAHRTSHIVNLGGVAVHPQYSGRGFGLQMMKEIIDLCQQKGYLRIELSAATINEKAIKLYEKVGFQKEGILRQYTHLKSKNQFLDEVLLSYLM